jgi:hypothetical protein
MAKQYIHGGKHTEDQIARRAANIEKVRKLLAERSMTAAELAEQVDVPTTTMNGYLYHLRDLGEARSVGGGHKCPRTWVADQRSVEEAADKAQAEHAQRAQIVKAQQIGMQRDPFIAALFGPAAQL